MAYTTDFNLAELPSGAVDWVAAFNDLVGKIEAGRTLQKIAVATITKYQCWYVDVNGKAAVASGTTDVVGIWQSTSTTPAATGYGQIWGTMTYGSWAWTPGIFLYSGASGALTATPSTTGRRIAYALTATKILILSNFMSTYTASKAMVTDASGNVAVSATTATQLGYVADLTSLAQAQIDTKAPIASPAFTGLVKLPFQELTASGAITSNVLGLNHATVAIAATLAAPAAGEPLFIIDTSASGTAAHTVRLTAGTFDGTNNTATLNAPDEALYCIGVSATRFQIMLNVGAVGLSST